MQTILGAGGAIGKKLAKDLTVYTKEIRLVSRNPKAVNPGDQLMKADLTVAGEVDRVVAGSSIVYLTVGVEYSAKAWQHKWPVIMRNVFDSCIRHQAKLVFFDNVYTYDRNHLGNMTEETPVRPTSKKGEVRNQVVKMLRSSKAPSAVFASNDWMALGLMHRLAEERVSIPEQLSIIGCDDIHMSAEISPGLSTFKWDMNQMVRELFGIIHTELFGDERSYKRVLLPARFITRDSLGTCKVQN